MKIQVKDTHSSQLGWMPFLTALELWLNHGGIEIARDADIKEYESDEEREQLQRIVKGVWNLMSENPKTEYMMHKEELDALEEETLREIAAYDVYRMEKQHLLNLLQANFLTHDRDTIRRRVDSIVEKGRLDRIKESGVTYYALKPTDRIHREITA